MKRKQIVLDRLEDIDNVLISLYQALQQPKDINVVRERLKDVDNLVRLEDHAY
jgi:hypothetical protein